MTPTKLATILALAAALTAPAAMQGLDADLQRAIQKETVTGDLKAAIDDYKQIVAKAGSNRTIAAQALMRMADCHQKLGNREARAVYETLVRDYADQKDTIAEARRRLATLQTVPIAPVGQITRQIWAGANADVMGSPSADGRYLSYTDWETGDLGVRDIAAGTNRRLTNTGGWESSGDMAEYSTVSPDGRQVAVGWYTHKDSRYDLRLLPIDGGKPRVVIRTGEREWIRPYDWTPDGKQILVLRGQKNPPANQIAVVSIADGTMRVIKTVAANEPRSVDLSPDGRHVAFEMFAADKPANTDIFVMGIDGAGETAAVRHPANDQFPMWSPDGRRLLFLTDRTSRLSLWAIGMAGGKPAGQPELIKADIGPVYPLGISRSGALMYYLGSGRRNPYVVELDADWRVAKPPAMVSERYVNSNSSAAWSPDGQFLAYYSFRGPQDVPGATALVIRNVSTGQERDLFVNVAIIQQNAVGLTWFPDGRSILVVARNPRQGSVEYQRVDVASGTATLLRSVAQPGGVATNSAVISPDGKALFYMERGPEPRGRQITRLDLDTGNATPFVSGGTGDRGATSLALSPDGSQIAYLNYEPESRSSVVTVRPIGVGQPRELHRARGWNGGDRFNTLAWSRDGRNILFVKAEGEHEHLWRVPAAGGAPQKVGVSVHGKLKAMSVHPDGKRVVYTAIEADGASAIWLLENFLPATTSRAGSSEPRGDRR